MNFALLESLNTIGQEIEVSVRNILVSIQDLPDRDAIAESADSVLGQLADKLKSNTLDPREADEYAQLYSSLALLAQDNIRQNFKIDVSTPDGKKRFARVIDGVGQDPGITAQVKKVATVNGESHYKDIKRDLENFASMDPQKKQQYINGVNKLRIGYERVKSQMGAGAQAAPKQDTQTGGGESASSAAAEGGGSSANSGGGSTTVGGSPGSVSSGM